ncbi:inositol monophosphatase [bacterium]|nr:inositol monophosphatase [bacterium]
MTTYLDAAIDAATMAGDYQITRLGTEVNVEYKGAINLVTEVDKACEKMIIERLLKEFPHHSILAEEGGETKQKSDYKWIIDPLDGTTNYAHGYPLFCVSIGLEYGGEIVAGVVYDPNRKELFTAELGSGSFVNGKKMQVSKAPNVGKSMLSTGFAYNIREKVDNNLDHFRKMILQAQAVRRDGVAAIDLCYVAAGRYDGFWELDLFAWDVAAGGLMIHEAGGKVTRFDGTPATVYDRQIAASNGLIHDELVGLLVGV